MASPANPPRSTNTLPSTMIATSAKYAAAQPGRATYSMPTGWISSPSTAALHFFGLRYMAVDSIDVRLSQWIAPGVRYNRGHAFLRYRFRSQQGRAEERSRPGKQGDREPFRFQGLGLAHRAGRAGADALRRRRFQAEAGDRCPPHQM